MVPTPSESEKEGATERINQQIPREYLAEIGTEIDRQPVIAPSSVKTYSDSTTSVAMRIGMSRRDQRSMPSSTPPMTTDIVSAIKITGQREVARRAEGDEPIGGLGKADGV